jgi:hypothetical protein
MTHSSASTVQMPRLRSQIAMLLASLLCGSALAQIALPNKSPIPNGTINAPNKLPPQLLPDLKIVSAGETSKNVYVVKVQNVGAIPAAASNIYCAASVETPTGGYAIERQASAPALAVNATHTANCDFNVGTKKIQPGEKIFAVRFVVNNFKVIRESTYTNNELRVTPGIPFAQ